MSLQISWTLLSILWGPFQVCQLQLISLPPSCSTAFLVLWQSSSTSLSLSLFTFFDFYLVVRWDGKVNSTASSVLSCLLSQGPVLWLGLSDLCLSQDTTEFYSPHSPLPIPVCAYILLFYGRISFSCTTPSGSPSPPSHVYYFYYYCTPLRVFYTSISRWFLTGVWVTESLHKSSEHFWPIWMVSTHPLISILQIPQPIWLYRTHQLLLLSLSLSCSIIFLVHYLSFHFLSLLPSDTLIISCFWTYTSDIRCCSWW